MSAAALALVLGAGVLLWLLSLRLKDASIVDVFWAPGFAAVAWAMADTGPRAWLVLTLVTIWALRLGLHIYLRHRGEDPRYAALRAKAGARWWWQSLFQVFLLQAALIWIISAPLQVAVSAAAPLSLFDAAGGAITACGLIVEALADLQLTRFRAEPANAGKVMDRGLWAWSRHPNYFGDALMWWGFFLIGVGASGQWWLIVSPVLMTVLLLRVSGVSLLEETIAERRPAYADYIRRTSAFVPWPPKRRPAVNEKH